MNLFIIGLYIQVILYVLAGINHFIMPKMYLKIMPEWVPKPEVVNKLVGIIQLILGLGLMIESLRSYAAIGIILMLIAVFPANVKHYQKMRKRGKLVIITAIRLPLQLLLIYWAWIYI